MIRDRCKSQGCKRQRMKGSDRCYYCARVPDNRQRLTPQQAARNIAAQLGERDDA